MLTVDDRNAELQVGSVWWRVGPICPLSHPSALIRPLRRGPRTGLQLLRTRSESTVIDPLYEHTQTSRVFALYVTPIGFRSTGVLSSTRRSLVRTLLIVSEPKLTTKSAVPSGLSTVAPGFLPVLTVSRICPVRVLILATVPAPFTLANSVRPSAERARPCGLLPGRASVLVTSLPLLPRRTAARSTLTIAPPPVTAT